MAVPRYPNNCVERFLEYVKFDTQSSEDSDTYPSTPGQLDLLRKLRDECLALGLDEVEMDEHGYVFASIPATSGKQDVPVIGFIAHVDTSPEMSGKDVKAIFHRNYDGGDIVLPDDPSAVITAAGNPALADQVGNDIITASGTTLLGADNKAGVAEIMAAAEYLLKFRTAGCGSGSPRMKKSAAAPGISTSTASAQLAPIPWTAKPWVNCRSRPFRPIP
jgi:tripeptide aminopeptidase